MRTKRNTNASIIKRAFKNSNGSISAEGEKNHIQLKICVKKVKKIEELGILIKEKNRAFIIKKKETIFISVHSSEFANDNYDNFQLKKIQLNQLKETKLKKNKNNKM